ncbi:MAG: dihydroorotase [Planctomycetes bacterium]|nr:dihydroorotase [Planctomycetota bacterium]
MPEGASILIEGGRVVDPAGGVDAPADLLLAGGVISSRGSERRAFDRVIDAAGLLVVPGLIDMHVHLREPGGEHKETIETGTAAAVAGGFTAVACMPNTVPPADTPKVVMGILQKAQEVASCRVYPVACLSMGRGGNELADFRALADAGAVAFSDDGDGLADNNLMAAAFEALAALDRPAIQHCEDPTFTRGVMHEGEVSSDLGLSGLSPLAEEFMIARDLALAEAHNARYHVAHISTCGAVELVRTAKAGNVRVTTEVCPHHLLLTDEACRTKDANFKMHPPLRPQRDVDACVAGVIDGTIDMLVTDHAPHTAEEKARGFLEAPPGIVGLETSLALFAKALIAPGHIDWYKLIELMSTAPARIFGLPGGSLAVGSPADVTLIDPRAEWTIDVTRFRSKGRNCPFDGMAVTGRVVCTIVGGEIKYEL